MVIADLAISIQIEPNNPKSHRILGLTYRALENFDKALSSFNKSIELDKSDETALYERGSFLCYDSVRRASASLVCLILVLVVPVTRERLRECRFRGSRSRREVERM